MENFWVYVVARDGNTHEVNHTWYWFCRREAELILGKRLVTNENKHNTNIDAKKQMMDRQNVGRVKGHKALCGRLNV